MEMCIALLCVTLLAAPLAAPLTAPLAAPPGQQCTELARRYAPRYQLAVDPGAFRPVKMEGRETEVVVWGGAGGAGTAAAALLHAALRRGLGYDAALRLQDFDMCTANYTQLAVAPAVAVRGCGDAALAALAGALARHSAAPAPRRAPLLARAPAACAPTAALPAHRAHTLRSCANALTLRDFTKLTSQLPRCNFTVFGAAAADPAAHVVLAVAADVAEEIGKLNDYVYENNISLIFLLSDDASCFRRTVAHLDKINSSFLFFDSDLESYGPGLFPVVLTEGAKAGERCPARALNRVTDRVHRLGDGAAARKYAPQIADVVQRFCPSLQHLKEVLHDRPDGSFEEAACKWALRNKDTFDSWISNKKYKYGLYCYLCADDPLNEEYKEVIDAVKRVVMTHEDFEINLHVIDHIGCQNDQDMVEHLLKTIYTSPKYVMGAITWSSREGVASVARAAARERVPLALAGAAGPRAAALAPALGGRLDDLAHFYRAFLSGCGWSRVAILSDGSTHADDFTEGLLRESDFVHVEVPVTSDTATDSLESLRARETRIFVVNTNSSLAVEIIQAAGTLGMKSPDYVWIVREWSPTKTQVANASWRDMSLFTLSTTWRGSADGAASGAASGAAGGAASGAAGGAVSGAADGAASRSAMLRAELQELWPGAAWPALAVPLIDAMLLLDYSFTIFQQLYSSNSYSMRHGQYALNFSQIYDRIKLLGVGRELSFQNGTVKTVTVYLEQWVGGSPKALAEWDARDRRAALPPGACARARDRPPCSFPAGGRAFQRRCLDLPLAAALAVLALLPLALAAARRARLKRLAVRDLNLLAHVLEGDPLAPVVPEDALRVHEKIGMGNFGSVYLATLRRSKERTVLVAAKELRDESDKTEYLQEAGILQQVDHENIVKFVGICLSKGSLLILMEYARHGDLLQYLRARRRLPATEPEAAHVSARALTRLAREAAAALAYLARRGVVHRDVRAANCLVDERRTLKLADFGLARKVGDDREYTSVRRAVLPVLWMAPESLRGSFSAASDVWALGVLLLELVTLGARPYGAAAPPRVLPHVLRGGHPPLPPDVSPHTVALVSACWQREPAARAAAGALQRYLERAPLALRPARLPAPELSPLDAPDLVPHPAPHPAPHAAPHAAPHPAPDLVPNAPPDPPPDSAPVATSS